MKEEILIRYDRCLGCRSCELACSVAHSKAGSLAGVVMAGEKPASRIFINGLDGSKVPLNCRHCEDAPCIDACITGAMHRDQFGVVTNEGGSGHCTGCWMCVMVCPYGVIRSDLEKRQAVKCDRACLDESGKTACVRACPTGALIQAPVDDISSKKRRDFLLRAFEK